MNRNKYQIEENVLSSDDYYNSRELNRKIHKKEPYIFTVTAKNAVGESTSEPTTTDVLPLIIPVVSNITSIVNPVSGQITLNFNINNGGSRVTNIKISSGTYLAEVKINTSTNQFTSNPFDLTIPTSARGSNYFSFGPSTTDNINQIYSIVLLGTTANTEYKFTITATNSVGSGSTIMDTPVSTLKVPEKPINVSAVDEKNGDISVTFTQPGGSIDNEIIATPENTSLQTIKTLYNTLGTRIPITVKIKDLSLGTIYKITVIGRNSIGSSLSSDPVTVTPTSVPKKPTGVSASVLSTEAGTVKVLFNEMTNIIDKGGVDAIKSYKVVSNPKNISATGTNSPITIRGLDPGTSYTFTVTAENVNGTSSPSDPSVSITTPTKPEKIIWDTTNPTKSLSNSIEFKFKTPNNGGSNITSYKFKAYYTDDAGKIYYETIEVPTTQITNNNDGTSTVILYTKQQKKYTKIPISTSDLYPSDPTKNPVEVTTNKTLSTSVQPYDRVPLLYYPIGNERKSYCDVKKNKENKDNKYCLILCIIIISIFILYLLNSKSSR